MQSCRLETQASERVCYASTCRLLWHEDLGGYISSGIVAYDTRGQVLAQLEDVSCDHRAVEELVQRLNEGEASPVHLTDIVEDFLNT